MITIPTSWAELKNIVDSKSLSIQFVETDLIYSLYAVDANLSLECEIFKTSPVGSDQTDFETNYKPTGNQRIQQVDVEGNITTKKVVALDGMHYEPRSLDFVTATLGSLYNRKHNGGTVAAGTDYGDGGMQFYDATDTELVQGGGESDAAFQARLDATCTKTLVNFTPTFTYAIKSGVILLREEWSYDAYLWCMIAPHIPEGSGGEVPFLSGGYNLQFFPAKSYIRMDGETVFVIEPDLTYYSHRIGLYVKHNAGDKKGIQMIYEMYK